MADIRINDAVLYYEEHGSGTPILCVHGTGSSALLWSDAVEELSWLGRVILYDRRGCTRSELPEPYNVTTIGEHTDDAAALLRGLGAGPAVVIGRSYGGEIAVDLLLRYPDMVQALVLLEPSAPALAAEMLAWVDDLTARVRAAAAADGPAATGDRFGRIVLGDETWEELPEEIRQIFVDNGQAILAELSGGWTRPDADALARVTQPVLLVSAESSPPEFRAADDALAAMIPGVQREIVPGGHLVDPAAPVVLDFIQSCQR